MKHGNRWKDLTGHRFGRLTVTGFKEKGTNNQSIWKCACDCGKITTVRTSNLTSKKVVSCGCYRLEQVWKSNAKDITGKRFGSLVALYWTGTVKGHSGRVWKCRCDCGQTRNVSISKLTQRRTLQCKACSGLVNGVKVSGQQRQIAQMINGLLNYRSGSLFVDIALPEYKVAVEYDGWYWHKDSEEKDKARTIVLQNLGWNVVHIKSRRDLPSFELLTSAIALSGKVGCVNIVMGDWNG